MKKLLSKKNGVTFLTAVFTLLLFGALAGAFASLIKRQAIGSMQFTLDEQLLFSADSGVEMAIDWLYQDDPTPYGWWDNADPADQTKLLPVYQNISLAGTNVNITSEYAATTLTSDITAIDTTIDVNSTAGFPDSGIILINTELIEYLGKAADETAFLSCIRGYDLSDPDVHSAGTFIYPASLLSSNIDDSVTTIPVSSTEKFLSSGTIFIDNEAIRYKSKDATNFLNCQRGSFDTSASNHFQNERIFPGSYEIFVTSTAQKDGREKTVEVLLQYQYGTKWE